jgi:hypothetical protein
MVGEMVIPFMSRERPTIDRLSVHLGVDRRVHSRIDQRIRAYAGLGKHQPGTDEASYDRSNEIKFHESGSPTATASALTAFLAGFR